MNFLKTMILAISLVAINSMAQSPSDKAAMDHQILVAVAEASKAWKDAFNTGDAKAATALYEEDAIMVVKPFGTYTGRDEILGFWTNLIEKGFDDVVYSDTVTTLIDEESVRIAADWKMNKASGVITNELWVIQSDGRALLRLDYFEVAQ